MTKRALSSRGWLSRGLLIAGLAVGLTVAGSVGPARAFDFTFGLFSSDNDSQRPQRGPDSGPIPAFPEWGAWPGPPQDPNATIVPAKNLTAANYVLVLDYSGSMDEYAGRRRKIDVLYEVVPQWIRNLGEDANLGVLAFFRPPGKEMDVYELLPIGTTGREDVIDRIRSIRAGGNTPLGLALGAALDRLEQQARRQSGYGLYKIVLVTDGVNTMGPDPRVVVDRIVSDRANPVEVHTIGFDIGLNHALNRPGETFYVSAGNATELFNALNQVKAEVDFADTETFPEIDWSALLAD